MDPGWKEGELTSDATQVLLLCIFLSVKFYGSNFFTHWLAGPVKCVRMSVSFPTLHYYSCPNSSSRRNRKTTKHFLRLCLGFWLFLHKQTRHAAPWLIRVALGRFSPGFLIHLYSDSQSASLLSCSIIKLIVSIQQKRTSLFVLNHVSKCLQFRNPTHVPRQVLLICFISIDGGIVYFLSSWVNTAPDNPAAKRLRVVHGCMVAPPPRVYGYDSAEGKLPWQLVSVSKSETKSV